MSRGVPGPLRRVLRQPLIAAALALLAATSVAASGIESAASSVLRATLDESWRGAYDILVTAPDGFAPIDGMLPPNTLAGSETGLSLDDLAAIRGVDGVEIAAPIGEIAVPGLKASPVYTTLPVGTVAGEQSPQAFRVTATYSTDDGLGERIVWRDDLTVVVDEQPETRPVDAGWAPASGPDDEIGYNDFTFRAGDYPALAAYLTGPLHDPEDPRFVVDYGQGGYGTTTPDDGEPYYVVNIATMPLSTTRITLVDPEAERALLGEAGDFLDPLVALHPGAATTVADAVAFADRAVDDRVAAQLRVLGDDFGPAGDPPEVEAELRRLYADNGVDYDEHLRELNGPGAAERPVIPLIVADDVTAPLTAKFDVEALGDAPHAEAEPGVVPYAIPEPALAGAPGEPVGSVSVDASSVFNPFTTATAFAPWPGTELPDVPAWRATAPLGAQQIGSTLAAGYEVRGGEIVLSPSGYRLPAEADYEDSFRLSGSGERIGSEAAYTSLADRYGGVNAQGLSFATLGTFDVAGELTDAAAANYVPLGAYGTVGATVTSGEHEGATMAPAVSGLGLVSARTAAIASIGSASLWNDERPIDAVRVRVAGVGAYTDEARGRVLQVAERLQGLGYAATVVAGSSPADVEVTVDGYAFGTTDAEGEQTVAPLGTVAQRWSELGAASRAELSVAGGTVAVFGIALATAILLLGAAQLAGIPGRRQQAAIMRDVGLTRARIARWYAAEELPGIAVLALVGAAAWWFAPQRGFVLVVLAVGVGAALVAAAASVVAGSRAVALPRIAGARSRRTGARGPAGFGARQAIVHPLVSVVHAVSLVLVGVAAAAVAAAIQHSVTAAGTSAIAGLVVARLAWPQALLGAIALLGAVLLGQLSRRMALARRAEQWAVLRAAGWTAAHIRTAQWAEGAAIIAPSVAVTAGAAWLGAGTLDLAPPASSAVIAAAAAAAAGILVFVVRRKGAHT